MNTKFNSVNASILYQSGVVLIVGLIMVLLLSIIAMAAIRSSGLQEAMAGNMRDHNIAFQAAESALSGGESIIDQNKITLAPTCNGIVCIKERAPANSVNLFSYTALKEIAGAKVTAYGLKNVNSQPVYIVEELTRFSNAVGEGSALTEASSPTNFISEKQPYRVTAVGLGMSEDTVVTVQSTYNRSPDN